MIESFKNGLLKSHDGVVIISIYFVVAGTANARHTGVCLRLADTTTSRISKLLQRHLIIRRQRPSPLQRSPHQ